MRYLLTFFLLFTFSLSKEDIPVTFIEDPSEPYVMGKLGQIPKRGITVDIINEVFKRIDGYKAKFVEITPWQRSLNLVEEGQVDAVSHILKNPQREKRFFFTNKVTTGKTVFFYKKEKHIKSWGKVSDLEKYSICTVSGYNVEKYLLSLKKENNLDFDIYTVSEFASCFKLLLYNRIDLYAENYHTGLNYLKNKKLEEKFSIMDKPVYEKNFYIAFSKNSKAYKLIPKINKILQQLEKDGIIEKIEEKYMNK